MDSSFIAIDIGASSGRVVISYLKNDKFVLDEVHRFSNYLIRKEQLLYWDINYIFNEIIKGIKKGIEINPNVSSIGIDTFGVDFVLLDEFDQMIQLPLSYRNNLGVHSSEKVNNIISKQKLYQKTGIQYMPFNTLYQLVYIKDELKIEFNKALLLPDYIAYLLTGVMRTEITNFSTTNLMSATEYKMIHEAMFLGIDKKIFPKFINPGEKYGEVSSKIKDILNVKNSLEVIAVCSHDTASAVASIPRKRSQLFLSSGTWGLLGTLSSKPVVTKKASEFNFSNELGYNNKIRLLKNTMGLWIQNESIRVYQEKYPHITREQINEEVLHVEPFKSFIDVDDLRFSAPENMIEEIKLYCSETNQPIPKGIGEIIMCIYQSLAFKYRVNIAELEEITKRNFKEIYIVGGGGNIELLNQMIASVTKKTVIVGETEATVIGNFLVQLKSKSIIDDLKDGLEMFRTRKERVYEPNQVSDYEDACHKYTKIIRRHNEKANN